MDGIAQDLYSLDRIGVEHYDVGNHSRLDRTKIAGEAHGKGVVFRLD